MVTIPTTLRKKTHEIWKHFIKFFTLNTLVYGLYTGIFNGKNTSCQHQVTDFNEFFTLWCPQNDVKSFNKIDYFSLSFVKNLKNL